MKKFLLVVVATFAVSFNAQARGKDPAPRTGSRPNNIECLPMVKVDDLMDAIRIRNFDTENPTTNLDANHVIHFQANTISTEYCASNECDNHYCLVFMNADMTQLDQGQTAHMVGTMRYYNGSTKDRKAHTIPVACKKAQSP